MRLVGIDPGLKGALALFVDDALVTLADMPVKGGAIDAAALADLLDDWRPDFVWCEDVGPRPTDGARAAFTFGMAYATVRTVLDLGGFAARFVAPSAWVAALGLKGTSKQQRKDVCRRYYPDAFGGRRRGDHADAALLGAYGIAQEGMDG